MASRLFCGGAPLRAAAGLLCDVAAGLLLCNLCVGAPLRHGGAAPLRRAPLRHGGARVGLDGEVLYPQRMSTQCAMGNLGLCLYVPPQLTRSVPFVNALRVLSVTRSAFAKGALRVS
jgi:hypothetical protein